MSILKYSRIICKSYPDRILFLVLRFLSYQLKFHPKIAKLPPAIATVIYFTSKKLTTYLIRICRLLFPNRYTDANPYKIIYVDPNEIQLTTGDPFSKRRGWVVNGNWDKEGQKFDDLLYPKAIRQHYVDGLSWEKTVLAKKYEGEALSRYCDKINSLYKNMRKNGYKSQSQLLKQNPDIAWQGLNDAMHPLSNEITIDIGRNGELLWNICGQHRLAIARALHIDRVPVMVFRRHAEWQAVRDNIRDIPKKTSTNKHPDLDDLNK